MVSRGIASMTSPGANGQSLPTLRSARQCFANSRRPQEIAIGN
jgi:hypothetical protein